MDSNHISRWVHTRTHTYTHTHTLTHTHTHTDRETHTHNTHTQHTDTYTHTHTHAHTPGPIQGVPVKEIGIQDGRELHRRREGLKSTYRYTDSSTTRSSGVAKPGPGKARPYQ